MQHPLQYLAKTLLPDFSGLGDTEMEVCTWLIILLTERRKQNPNCPCLQLAQPKPSLKGSNTSSTMAGRPVRDKKKALVAGCYDRCFSIPKSWNLTAQPNRCFSTPSTPTKAGALPIVLGCCILLRKQGCSLHCLLHHRSSKHWKSWVSCM